MHLMIHKLFGLINTDYLCLQVFDTYMMHHYWYQRIIIILRILFNGNIIIDAYAPSNKKFFWSSLVSNIRLLPY